MKKAWFLNFSFIFFTLLLYSPGLYAAEDPNEVAYQNRFALKSGTILNSEGKGDSLIFPYYDVRRVEGNNQITEIRIENTGEYGIVARLRVREWDRGREVFSRDIWIPSSGVWTGAMEINEDGTNGVFTSLDNVVSGYDSGFFYLADSLSASSLFSTRYIHKNNGGSTLYGYVEVIGSEKTSPENINGKVSRLAKAERDCPNALNGAAVIQRVEDQVFMTYDAVAIGNFSRGQGSLFRTTGRTLPRLDICEDSLDQFEFQLSKCEMRGSYSLDPSTQSRTSIIVTFPTKHFHYRGGSRIKQVDNPFEAPREKGAEIFGVTLSEEGQNLTESEIDLPFSVNVIGLYRGDSGSLSGIDNLPLVTNASELGEATLTSDNFAHRHLIPDFENYFESNQGRFMMYKGLPAVALVLQESRDAGQLNGNITPAGYSRCWTPSNVEVVLAPSVPSGPTFGIIGTSYSFTATGASSSVGHSLQYQFDWNGDGSSDLSAWGSAIQSKTWSTGGVFTVRVRARCATHTSIVSKWSSGLVVTIESVSAPTLLSGPIEGIPNQSYSYTASGAVSTAGHALQYQFDWGDDTTSEWGPATQSKSWTVGGPYNIMARARCATHTDVVSEWTSGLTVTIEIVTIPSTPVGPSLGSLGVSYSFTTSGSTSNLSHPLEYQFDWGDETFSTWGSSTRSKSWNKLGTFVIKVRARCVTHPTVESAWSNGLNFDIEAVSTPAPPTGPINGMRGVPYTYLTSGAISSNGHSLEYQFDWKGDGTTDLSPWDGSSQTKAWSSSGTYNVKVRARCSIHPTLVTPWSAGLTVVIEFISTPSAPSGPTTGTAGNGYNYTTGGSSSDRFDPVEYRFDWGDGSTSAWGPASRGIAWANPGTYTVKAQGRCTIHTNVMSAWSAGTSVTINPAPSPPAETISTPWIEAPSRTDPPSTTNAIEGIPGIPYTYTAQGGTSNLGHTTQYLFTWSDGSTSGWGAATQAKAWASSGIYTVTVQVRCAQHPTVLSAMSTGYTVVIEHVSSPSTPTGAAAGTIGAASTYTTGGSSSGLGDAIQYRFWWGDGSNSGWLPVGTVTADKSWAIPGTYTVRAEARCATHIGAVSVLSASISVTITTPP